MQLFDTRNMDRSFFGGELSSCSVEWREMTSEVDRHGLICVKVYTVYLLVFVSVYHDHE